MRRHSPYNYAFDNPVWFIDPGGMASKEWGALWLMRAFTGTSEEDQDEALWENEDDPKKKKGESSQGYLSSLGEELKNIDVVSGAVNTWTNWLGRDKSTFLADMGSVVQSTYWSFASLLDGNTYINFYQDQRSY